MGPAKQAQCRYVVLVPMESMGGRNGCMNAGVNEYLPYDTVVGTQTPQVCYPPSARICDSLENCPWATGGVVFLMLRGLEGLGI